MKRFTDKRFYNRETSASMNHKMYSVHQMSFKPPLPSMQLK